MLGPDEIIINSLSSPVQGGGDNVTLTFLYNKIWLPPVQMMAAPLTTEQLTWLRMLNVLSGLMTENTSGLLSLLAVWWLLSLSRNTTTTY